MARQRGVALVIVLWILLLVTISTSAYTLMARMDQLEAHTVLSGTQARMAAEAGMNLGILSLRDPDETARLVPDGRPYRYFYRGVVVEIQVTDERGKLDVNASDETTLFTLLTGNGLDESDAVLLAAAIMDWKDPDEMERPDGAELQTYESAGPAYAPAEALLALPDVSEEDARNFVADRHSQESLDGSGAALPNGQVAMARGGGVTYSILAKATLPNGVWDQIETTIRLGGGPDGLPYRILRWREGFHH